MEWALWGVFLNVRKDNFEWNVEDGVVRWKLYSQAKGF